MPATINTSTTHCKSLNNCTTTLTVVYNAHLLSSQPCPETKNLTHTTSHLTMTNMIPTCNDPTKQSASCQCRGPPALPPMPCTMSSMWHSNNLLSQSDPPLFKSFSKKTIHPVKPSPQNSITHQTGFNITSTLKRAAMALSIPSLKK
jgi:hypothetical protein